MKLNSQWTAWDAGSAKLMTAGSGPPVRADRHAKDVGSWFLLDVQTEPLRRVEDEIANGVGIAQNGVGGLQLQANFRRLERALGEPRAVDPLALGVSLPSLVERLDLGQAEIELKLDLLGQLVRPAPQEQGLEQRLRHGLALLRHRHMGAERPVDLARLVQEDVQDNAIDGAVGAEVADGLDHLRGLAVAVDAPLALLQPVGVPRQVVMQGGVEHAGG